MSMNDTPAQESAGSDDHTGGGHIIETAAPAVWSAPEAEIDKYGVPTGDHYVTCRACGVEVLTSLQEYATHRAECPHAED